MGAVMQASGPLTNHDESLLSHPRILTMCICMWLQVVVPSISVSTPIDEEPSVTLGSSSQQSAAQRPAAEQAAAATPASAPGDGDGVLNGNGAAGAGAQPSTVHVQRKRAS